MKMIFPGWGREVIAHNHAVTPVVKTGLRYSTVAKSSTLDWHGPVSALGKVNFFKLTGSFLVEFEFETNELKNWLGNYVKHHPEEAIRLLAEMQAEAIINLRKQ